MNSLFIYKLIAVLLSLYLNAKCSSTISDNTKRIDERHIVGRRESFAIAGKEYQPVFGYQ
jgi:hypothetical protein